MKGFMRQRGDAWELRVYLGRDAVTGKQRYASRTVRGGKRIAQRALAELVTNAERGLLVRTNATTGELIEAWFEQAAGDFSPKTVKETRGFIDRNLLPAVGGVPLTKLKASDLDRLYRRLQSSGAVDGCGLAPATVRRIHGILRRALAQGVKWGWLGINPAAATTPPRVPQPEIKPPATADLARVLQRASSSSPDLACFLVLAAASGARRSELVALRWHDVDLADGTVRIERGVVMGPAGLVEKDTKTHAARRVALDDRTIEILRAHRARMTERAETCRVEAAEESFVFSNAADGSEPWYPDSVSRGYKRICVEAGLPGARLHDLRHFVASQLLTAGVDVRTVAGRLGHRNAATTLNVYAHFLEQADRSAAEVIGSVIAGEPHSITARRSPSRQADNESA
jgi:integrase